MKPINIHIVRFLQAIYTGDNYMTSDEVEQYRSEYEQLVVSNWGSSVQNTDIHQYKIHIKVPFETFASLRSQGLDGVPYWVARKMLRDLIRKGRRSGKVCWLDYKKYINVAIPANDIMNFDRVILYCFMPDNVVDYLNSSCCHVQIFG